MNTQWPLVTILIFRHFLLPPCVWLCWSHPGTSSKRSTSCWFPALPVRGAGRKYAGPSSSSVKSSIQADLTAAAPFCLVRHWETLSILASRIKCKYLPRLCTAYSRKRNFFLNFTACDGKGHRTAANCFSFISAFGMFFSQCSCDTQSVLQSELEEWN